MKQGLSRERDRPCWFAWLSDPQLRIVERVRLVVRPLQHDVAAEELAVIVIGGPEATLVEPQRADAAIGEDDDALIALAVTIAGAVDRVGVNRAAAEVGVVARREAVR